MARGEVAPGRRPRLDSEAAQALDLALRSEPADGGLWTAPKVARLLGRAHRHECQPEHGVARHAPTRIYLADAPPQASARGDHRRASRVQKKLGEQVANLQRAYPAETVELWTQDEARLGLKPILRRQWAPRGQRPVATGTPG